MDEDEIRKNLQHEYMEELLFQEEQRLAAEDSFEVNQGNQQDDFDEEALRLTIEAEERWKAAELEKDLAKKKRRRILGHTKGITPFMLH